ncbi:MAG TPA: carbamoyltransferase HypF, partial [Pseudomonadales bacterium]|nr:carbamoyltransferase HypF [Pseudomonadales bacterium]
TCAACLREMRDPADRRYRYPFINCTHCGPRFSIIRAIPYDRANTSMQAFTMCEACQQEYQNPADRRFHAQPLACPMCGPGVWLENAAAEKIPLEGHQDAIALASALLKQGAIVAIKGLGGFHLACDASNEAAVKRLRQRKQRPEKPFALMVRNGEIASNYVHLTLNANALLHSAAAPIVVLKSRHAPELATAVAPAQNYLGLMLPYTPLHHLLLESWNTPLVMTSGNRSGEVQCISNDEARIQLNDIADYFLLHDREIINRLDDSVVQFMDDQAQWLRCARGVTPAPIALPPGFENAPPLLALGGELKNTFCLIADGKAIYSHHQGDLEDASVYYSYRNAINRFEKLYHHAPALIAIDQHPDYLSSKLGWQISQQKNIPLFNVQHHHAHIAACLLEYGIPRDAAPVLGIALDGLGYGAEGELWGGEFILADYRHSQRLARLQPVALPGGARAMKEPWRNAVASLHQAFCWREIATRYPQLEFFQSLEEKPVETLVQMLDQNINSPPASSAGRLFDAVAAVLGICEHRISYEGQAAILLEQCAESAWDNAQAYPFEIKFNKTLNLHEIIWNSFWAALLNDLNNEKTIALIAANFHKTLVAALASVVDLLQTKHAFCCVALTGGVLQNRLVASGLIKVLTEKGVSVLLPRRMPANDGGIALGQAMIALAHYSN